MLLDFFCQHAAHHHLLTVDGQVGFTRLAQLQRDQDQGLVGQSLPRELEHQVLGTFFVDAGNLKDVCHLVHLLLDAGLVGVGA